MINTQKQLNPMKKHKEEDHEDRGNMGNKTISR